MRHNHPTFRDSRNRVLSGTLQKTLTLLFIAGFCMGGPVAYGQTTIQLEQQCDCKILSGTAVNAAGGTTPSGADTGDVYINTESGRLFFWDGDSWEYSRSLNRSLRNLNFDGNTSLLTLETQDGRTFTADLSTLKSTGVQELPASDVTYNNSSTGFTATTVQEALDELSSITRSYPRIYATGKVDGLGNTDVIYQSTVQRLDEGDYQVTFDQPLPNRAYIIQVSVLDCDGDCPGNTSDRYDSPAITYYDQQPTGFKVNIGDSDNGVLPKDDIDLEFMFTVITLPN